MIKNILLSGGGTRGLCYVGILKYLEEKNIIEHIQNILGVSIGSLFGLMIILDIKSKQLRYLINFLNDDDMKDININNILNFFMNYGIDSGIKLEKFIKACIKVKLNNENATFTDLYNYKPNKRLLILGTEMTTYKKEWFSYEHTPNFEIWKAIRLSCSFPIYFNPVRIDNKLYVDGGVICNYPIDYFKNDLDNTIGIVFKDKYEHNQIKIENFKEYFTTLLNILRNTFEDHLVDIYRDNTITINTSNDVLDYRLSMELKEKYYEIGYIEFKRGWEEKFIENEQININMNDDINNEIEDIKSQML
jgi:NTE family protein